jgi:glycosyltransferase involved in cell wall biosynthesis
VDVQEREAVVSTRILEFELSERIPKLVDLNGDTRVMALLRFQGCPAGTLHIECAQGVLTQEQLLQALEADEALSSRLSKRYLKSWLLQKAPVYPVELPTWSVIICTRDRPEQLIRCLESISQAQNQPSLPEGEVIVVDNASAGEETARLSARLPVRYLREDRPGLNWARSAGARFASGEVVIYADDDVVVDGGWIRGMLQPFQNPRVGAVTGLILPLELETPAQELFEEYGGFGRGFEKRIFDYTNIAPSAAGYVGAGASMALRRSLVNELGLFDAELDCGTKAETGGDAYAFYRLLAGGYQIAYNPEALSWHHHRRDYVSLRRTLAGYSVGGFAFLTRCLILHKDFQAPVTAAFWLWSDHARQLAHAMLGKPNALPLDLVLAQFAGVLRGIRAYFSTRRHEISCANGGFQQASAAPALPASPKGRTELEKQQEI